VNITSLYYLFVTEWVKGGKSCHNPEHVNQLLSTYRTGWVTHGIAIQPFICYMCCTRTKSL